MREPLTQLRADQIRHFTPPKPLAVEEGFTPFAGVDDEIDYDTAMRLPDGKTCGDCVHRRRCVAMFGHAETDTSCDFYPSQFREAPVTCGEAAA